MNQLSDGYRPLIIRALLWITLFGALYLLRSFSLLIFLTFVFGYIQATGVERLEGRIKSRTIRVVTVALLLLGVLVGIGAFVAPKVKEQGKIFADRYPSYLQTMDRNLIELSEHYSVIEEVLPVSEQESLLSHPWDPKTSPTALFVQQALGLAKDEGAHPGLKQTIDMIRNVGAYLIGIGSAFLLSLLFSFLIVLDLPNLTASVHSLRDTKLRFVYDEVGDTIFLFARVLGRALEAQLFIAILNTVLTGLGLWALGLAEKIAFLLVIVFVCSFIPVAGVFISSVPIALVALQESGVGLLLLSAGMIIIVHFVEAYILNPKIYGHHLRMNPVIVLIILTMGGKLFHVWGLILGVPLCTYIFGHAIQFERDAELTNSGTNNNG